MKKKNQLTVGGVIATAMLLFTSPGFAQDSPQGTEAIRPFHVSFPDADLADLRRRIQATRWPEKETVADATQGVQLGTMRQLAAYWGKDYNWRKIETKLNSLPQFITNIDGVDIHFIHVRSKVKNAMPIIITHGWPGSVIEQLKVIGPLTDPAAYGAKEEDAFDVVIPSLCGATQLGSESIQQSQTLQ
jgi:hypothetical protein